MEDNLKTDLKNIECNNVRSNPILDQNEFMLSVGLSPISKVVPLSGRAGP
jgi:hypothetical protein